VVSKESFVLFFLFLSSKAALKSRVVKKGKWKKGT